MYLAKLTLPLSIKLKDLKVQIWKLGIHNYRTKQVLPHSFQKGLGTIAELTLFLRILSYLILEN